MEEHKLLRACIDSRAAYVQVDKANERSILFSDLGEIVFNYITDYYHRDKDASSVDTSLLFTRMSVDYPKHIDRIKAAIDLTTEVSSTNLIELLRSQEKILLKQRLANALLQSDEDAVNKLIKEYKGIDSEEDESEQVVYQDYDVERLVKEKSEGSILLYPKQLQDIVGKVNRGHHIVVYARPEVGKTAVTYNLVYGFLRQKLRVMYVGNEDPHVSMIMRMLSRLSERTEEEISADPKGSYALAVKNGYKGFMFVERGVGSPREIENTVERLKPDVVVVDQIRNVQVKAEGKTVQLEQVASFMRRLGKEHNVLCVSVTQAGDSATDKRILVREDIADSKTGVQGTADVMIGVGMDSTLEMSSQRMLSVCKNKISGRHDVCLIAINPALSKVW